MIVWLILSIPLCSIILDASAEPLRYDEFDFDCSMNFIPPPPIYTPEQPIIFDSPNSEEDCIDGKNNLIYIVDNENGIAGNNAIKIVEKIGIALYNSKGFPSCTIDGEGVFLLPGKAQIISGVIKVDRPLNLNDSQLVLMLLNKNDNTIGAVCREGKSVFNGVLNDDQCSMNLCNQTSEAKMLCKMLENPGTYNVKTHRLQEDNISHDGSESATFPAVGFLFDQEIPTYFHPIIQGRWMLHFELRLSNGTRLLNGRVVGKNEEHWFWVDPTLTAKIV